LPPRQYITLVDTLARFQLTAEARRFTLGYLWWFLEPMLYVGVFYLVFDQLLGNRQPDFLVFLAVGKLAFIWFSKSVNQAAGSLLNSNGLIAQINLPKHLFPLSVVQEGVYRQAAVFTFLIIFLFFAGYPPHLNWLWLVPLLALQYLMIIGCAMLGALLVCWRRDFQMLIQLGMVFLLFMSGVFWDVQTIQNTELVQWLSISNPLLVLLNAYRDVLMAGRVPDVGALLWVLVESLLLLTVAIWLYQRLNYWLAQRALTQ
jgi:lipopolysaccharide transport system permease protein